MIDLRSDVVTPPTEEMWQAMGHVELGWSTVNEDCSVTELEALGADLVGKESAMFVPTCSMGNVLALMTLGERGTQVILESSSHIACSEYRNVADMCGLLTQLVEGTYGVLVAERVDTIITAAEFSGLPSSLVCLENSHNNAGGTAVTPGQTTAIAEIAHQHRAAVHLDGARLFNSAAALGISPKDLTKDVDTVSFSLNKGLSAPFGALLCGSREKTEAAKSNCKRLGAASLHKEGILAAAGVVALKNMVDRLGDDNRRASRLGRRLAQFHGLHVDLETVQTNIILINTARAGMTASEFVTRLAQYRVLAMERSADRVRFVTHRLIGDLEVERVVEAVAAVLGEAVTSVAN